MKFFAIIALVISTNAFAAKTETKMRAPAQTENVSAMTTENTNSMKNIFNGAETMKKAYMSLNFIDLSKGNGNLGVDILMDNKLALGIRFQAFSEKEEVKKEDQKVNITVDRVAYAVGGTFFVNGIDSQKTIAISPALMFGQKRDAVDVESQNGLGLKLTGVMKLKNEVAVEAGLRGDNLEGPFTGTAYAGFGYLF